MMLDLDVATGTLSAGAATARLSRTELAVYRRIMLADGALVTRGQLHHAIYGDRIDGGPHAHVVDVYIAKIRCKLRTAGMPSPIRSVPGYGWQLVGVLATRALSLTGREWTALETALSAAHRVNPGAVESVRAAMQRSTCADVPRTGSEAT